MNAALQNEIGPAATPIAPDRGSTHPTKEKLMNMQSNSTLSAITPACCVTLDQIRQMNMGQRRAYYDALRLVETALGGIINQPRFFNDSSVTLNPAGDMIDSLHTFIIESIDVLVKATKAEAPTDPDEVETKAWIILLYEADSSDSVPDFVAIAAQQSAALAEAEFHAKHRGRKS